jgi:hypothetical protein
MMNEIIDDRDMIYGGYYQNIPGNMMYGNFSFQGCPGSLMNGNIFTNMMGIPQNGFNSQGTNNTIDINTRLNNLETRVRLIEQRLGNNNSYTEDNNSMYII